MFINGLQPNIFSEESMSQFKEQKDMIYDLQYKQSKMSRDDYDIFQIFVRRQKDDEDFDKESFNKLKALYEKYAMKKSNKIPEW